MAGDDSFPLVTIGLPVYNGAPTIERAVRSVLEQTYPRLRLFISDNASVDGTAEICQLIASEDQRVSLVQNERNLGARHNFNRVFLETTGRYFKWISHDDRLEKSAVERAVEVLESHPDVAVAHWLERITDSSGQILRAYRVEQAFNIDGSTSGQRFRQMLNWRRLGFAGDPIYGVIRRSALQRTELLPNKLNPNFLLLQQLSLVGRIYTLPQVLATRVYNSVRTTANDMLAWLDPESTDRFPHFRKWYEQARIGIPGSKGSSVEMTKTAASLLKCALRPEELKGFAWDVRRLLKGR